MRMWHRSLIPVMCNKHLLGFHGEIHKHRHNFVKKHSIAGRLRPIVQIEPLLMNVRHDEIAVEMIRRGMNHCSPYVMPDLSYLSAEEAGATVDRDYDIKDLASRCEECRKIITGERNE